MPWINNNVQTNGAGLWQQNGEQPFGPSASTGAGWMTSPAANGDGFQPNWWGSGAWSGANASGTSGSSAAGASSLLSQIVTFMQQYLGNASSSMPAAAFAPPGSATFNNATLSSNGDPHLALSGTEENANGTTTNVNTAFDNMQSHGDLFSTNDFGDHLRVSTNATQPDANGVTYNGSATATMNGGRDQVTMAAGGAVSVTSNGAAVDLSAGQTIALAGGETVSENTSGAVSISEQKANGEALTTTFVNNGPGVNVVATASGGVTMNGFLVRQAVNASS